MRKLVLSGMIMGIIFALCALPAFADIGPKPTLDIVVKNIDVENCYLDLLSQLDSSKLEILNDKYPEEYRDLPLYKYNEDGWVATHIRDFLCFGDLEVVNNGNDEVRGSFTYFGVPKEFKVIIQYKTGELFVSKKQYSFTEFNQVTTIDFNTEMEKVKVPEPNFKYGDVNGDGKVTSGDYTLVRRYILKIIDKFESPNGIKAADVNGDGRVNVADYTLIRRYLLNLIDIFPAEEDLDSSAKFNMGNNRFALNMFKQLNNEDKEKNVFISPISISTALSMVYEGAAAGTKEEMAKVLGYEGIDMQELNSSYKNLLNHLNNADEKVKLDMSNSILIHEKLAEQIKGDFLTSCKSVFGALVATIDFDDSVLAADKINKWISEATNDKINNMVTAEDIESVTMCLVNAIYFNAKWTEVFDEYKTLKQYFYTEDGKSQQVSMMKKTGNIEYGEGSDYQVVRLPYGNGKTSMYCILPLGGLSINEFTKTLGLSKWNEIKKSISPQMVKLSLPKFKMEYGVKELKNSLNALGMIKAFDNEIADFTGITPNLYESLYIEKVLHKAAIEVTEKGTEASGSTVVIMPSAPSIQTTPVSMKNFTANCPFIFAIVDDEEEAILFMGKMQSPPASEETQWLPYTPKDHEVDLSVSKDLEGNYSAVVKLSLPSAGFRVDYKDEVAVAMGFYTDGTIRGSYIGSANIEQSTDDAPAVIKYEYLRYNLGKVDKGSHTFKFSSNGFKKSINFTVPDNEPEEWLPYTPSEHEYDLSIVKDDEGVYKAIVSLMLDSGTYRVDYKDEVAVAMGINPDGTTFGSYIGKASVEKLKTSLIPPPVMYQRDLIYTLGAHGKGTYTFRFLSKSISFTAS